MNSQEIFDKVVLHLLEQGERCSTMDEDGKETCLYRGPEGMRCAVGCLIPDDLYDPGIEKKRVSSLPESIREVIEPTDMGTGTAIVFLERLQDIHDNETAKDWPNELRALADRYALDANVLDGTGERV